VPFIGSGRRYTSSPRSGVVDRRRWGFNSFGHFEDEGDPGRGEGEAVVWRCRFTRADEAREASR
jgi:hypothetical protein